jgi:hypothetical protein
MRRGPTVPPSVRRVPATRSCPARPTQRRSSPRSRPRACPSATRRGAPASSVPWDRHQPRRKHARDRVGLETHRPGSVRLVNASTLEGWIGIDMSRLPEGPRLQFRRRDTRRNLLDGYVQLWDVRTGSPEAPPVREPSRWISPPTGGPSSGVRSQLPSRRTVWPRRLRRMATDCSSSRTRARRGRGTWIRLHGRLRPVRSPAGA